MVASVALGLIVGFFAPPAWASAGTVHLKNGGWIDGELMEVVPDQHVLVRLSDGTVRDVPWAEVDHVVRNSDASQSGAPATITTERQASALPQASGAIAEQRSVAPVVTDERDRARPPAIGPTLALLGATSFGGGIHESATTNEDGVQDADVASGDLAPTYGGAVHVNWPLHPYISIGALVRAMSFRSETATRRSLMLDGAVVPRVQYVFEAGGTRGALFFQVPVGLGWVQVHKPSSLPTDVSFTWETSPAFVFGIGGGLQMLLTRAVGLTLDVGWLHHAFSYHITGAAGGSTSSADFSYQIDQVIVEGGLLFEL
jgi:hypothetical protein